MSDLNYTFHIKHKMRFNDTPHSNYKHTTTTNDVNK